MTVRELINGLLNCNMDANIGVVLTISKEKMEGAIEEGEDLYLSNLQIDHIENGNYPSIILEDAK